jgi:hypothetical protein
MKKYRYEIALGYTLIVLAMILVAYWFIGTPWVLALSLFALIPFMVQ